MNDAEKAVLVINPTGSPGATIVRRLAAKGWKLVALAHPDERPAVEALSRRLPPPAQEGGGEPLRVLWGDSGSVGAGLDSRTIDELARTVGCVVHCPPLAVKDRERWAQVNESVVKGTDQVISLAHRLPDLAALVQVSSAYVSGNYPGRFYEDWLDVGQGFFDPLHRNHFIAETKLRNAARSLPVVVLRCGLLVGDSDTGRCEEDEGLLPLFGLLERYARAVPRPLPLLFPDSSENILSFTPDDYCADALARIMRDPAAAGSTFCLTDPTSPSVRAFVDTMSDLMGRTCYRLSLDRASRLPLVEPLVLGEWFAWAGRALKRSTLPLRFIFQRGDYDTTNTSQALAGSAVACAPFSEYVERLYRFYSTRYA